MSSLNECKVKRIACILGNVSYTSEVQRAEDVVSLFANIPKGVYLEAIEYILFLCGSREDVSNSEEIGVAYQTNFRRVGFALDSLWGEEFRMSFHVALEKNSLEEVADVIHSSMDNAFDFVYRVAIFSYIFSCLRYGTPPLVKKSIAK